jgi:hypothetical protein
VEDIQSFLNPKEDYHIRQMISLPEKERRKINKQQTQQQKKKKIWRFQWGENRVDKKEDRRKDKEKQCIPIEKKQ